MLEYWRSMGISYLWKLNGFLFEAKGIKAIATHSTHEESKNGLQISAHMFFKENPTSNAIGKNMQHDFQKNEFHF